MMKYIFIVVALISLSLSRAEAQDGRDILEDAFNASNAASFKATMQNPFPPLSREDEILPYAAKWVFHRLASPEGVFLRLDSFANDQLMESYVKNEHGVYGRAADGFAAGVIEVPLLWCPELVFQEIAPQELSQANYKIASTMRGSTPCYRVFVQIPDDEFALMEIHGESKEQNQAREERCRAKWPSRYEFVIGKQDLLIYERRHYNRDGKLILSINLGTVEMIPPESKLFQTPPDLQGKFIERDVFASRVLGKMLARNAPSRRERFLTWANDCFWRSSGTLTWVTGIFGCGILVFLAIAKMRRAKRTK